MCQRLRRRVRQVLRRVPQNNGTEVEMQPLYPPTRTSVAPSSTSAPPRPPRLHLISPLGYESPAERDRLHLAGIVSSTISQAEQCTIKVPEGLVYLAFPGARVASYTIGECLTNSTSVSNAKQLFLIIKIINKHFTIDWLG